ENINVVSIVGRFLEHSRIYAFERGGETSVFMGSADLMPRNLDARVELVVPVVDPHAREHVLDTLDRWLRDTENPRALPAHRRATAAGPIAASSPARGGPPGRPSGCACPSRAPSTWKRERADAPSRGEPDGGAPHRRDRPRLQQLQARGLLRRRDRLVEADRRT